MRALILVDIQNDFLPDGALPVPKGHEVIPVANRLQQRFQLVVATMDWHPKDHCSFADNHEGHEIGDVVEVDGLEQILWPAHCVQNTRGAELAVGLEADRITKIFLKGTDPQIDSYSGFYDNGHRKATGLDAFLKARGVDTVYILGLAEDVCVKFTVLDACQLGYTTYLVEDGCRGVEQEPGDTQAAVEEMEQAGATVIRGDEVPDESDA